MLLSDSTFDDIRHAVYSHEQNIWHTLWPQGWLLLTELRKRFEVPVPSQRLQYVLYNGTRGVKDEYASTRLQVFRVRKTLEGTGFNIKCYPRLGYALERCIKVKDMRLGYMSEVHAGKKPSPTRVSAAIPEKI